MVIKSIEKIFENSQVEARFVAEYHQKKYVKPNIWSNEINIDSIEIMVDTLITYFELQSRNMKQFSEMFELFVNRVLSSLPMKEIQKLDKIVR